MALTKICGGSVLVLAAAMAVAACDPYPARNTARPEILAVFASNGSASVDGTQVGTGWTLDIPGNVVPGDPTATPPVQDVVGALEPVVFVSTNQLLDGSTIQTADGDCTPKEGWLSPAGWYTCYYPSSSTPVGSGSIVLFLSPQPISSSNGWFALASLPVGAYALSGSVLDQNGNALPISVSVTVSPPPARPGTITIGTVTSAVVSLSWVASPGTPTAVAGYNVQRTVPVAGVTPQAPDYSAWATLNTSPVADLSYTDATVASSSTYYYRVIAVSAGGGGGSPSPVVSVNTP